MGEDDYEIFYDSDFFSTEWPVVCCVLCLKALEPPIALAGRGRCAKAPSKGEKCVLVCGAVFFFRREECSDCDAILNGKKSGEPGRGKNELFSFKPP